MRKARVTKTEIEFGTTMNFIQFDSVSLSGLVFKDFSGLKVTGSLFQFHAVIWTLSFCSFYFA